MKKEDIDFLRELQHELNTQEHDEQASPRFWGIIEDVEYPASEDCYDNAYIYDNADCEVRSYEQIVDWVDDIISDEHPELKDEWNEDVKENYELEDLCEWIKDNLDWDVEVVYSRNYEKLSEETGCFLTKKAAKRHLELNHYHYKNGKTYAMTAWRNPEFERVLNILQTMNVDDIKVTEE